MKKQTSQTKLRRAWGRKTLQSTLFPRVRRTARWRAALAHHEARHAVAYTISGIGIEHVTIVQDRRGGADGLCRERAGDSWFDRGHVTGALAGVVAEARYRRCGIFALDPATWDADWSAARERIADDLGKDDVEEWEDAEMDAAVDEAFDETKRAVAECWPLIERVASALLECERLEGDEVMHLCGRLSLLKPPAILAQKMVAR